MYMIMYWEDVNKICMLILFFLKLNFNDNMLLRFFVCIFVNFIFR